MMLNQQNYTKRDTVGVKGLILTVVHSFLTICVHVWDYYCVKTMLGELLGRLEVVSVDRGRRENATRLNDRRVHDSSVHAAAKTTTTAATGTSSTRVSAAMRETGNQLRLSTNGAATAVVSGIRMSGAAASWRSGCVSRLTHDVMRRSVTAAEQSASTRPAAAVVAIRSTAHSVLPL